MKPTMFDERVAHAIKNWHKSAKRKIKLQHTRKSSSINTPDRGTLANESLSPVHLLRYYQMEAAHRASMSEPTENNNLEITDASSSSLSRHREGSDSKLNYELQDYLEGEYHYKQSVVPGDCTIDVDSNEFSFDTKVNR